MATVTLVLKVLPALLCLVDGQTIECKLKDWPPSGSAVDDKLLNGSVVALQDQVHQLVGQMKDLQADLLKLQQSNTTNDTGVNVKQCSKRPLNDDRTTGLLMSCNFVKKQDETVLRVVWNGMLRLIYDGNTTGSCRRWYFTLNGEECSEPQTIDTQIFTNSEGRNRHRPAYVEGYCRGIAAGPVLVEWNIGDCISQTYGTGASYTGWEVTVRIIVEEVNVNDASATIN